jgi:hypothetical protein
VISLNPVLALQADSLFQLLPACRALLVMVCCLTSPFSTTAADKSLDLKSLPAPERVIVPQLRGPVTVAGDLTEPAWANGAVLTPFFRTMAPELSERNRRSYLV